VQQYYEELWQRLPDGLEPERFARRRAFLLGAARPGERALDLGCGAGEFAAALGDIGARITGADVAEAALLRARKRNPGVEFVRVPFDGPLPFEDGSFELVWAGEVIEHIADTGPWLSEVRRVLAPRGRLLLTTPSHGRLRVAVFGVEHFSEPLGDHLHLYTRRSLTGLLGEFGFGSVRVHSVGGLPLFRESLWATAVR
jgi:ubiquinone/menaquinone biosynthesis C-methylase UbiE